MVRRVAWPIRCQVVQVLARDRIQQAVHVWRRPVFSWLAGWHAICLPLPVGTSTPQANVPGALSPSQVRRRWNHEGPARHAAGVPKGTNQTQKEVYRMGLGTILLIILVFLLLGAAPAWPYSREWGYYPSGGIGLVLLIVLLLVLFGVVR